MERLRRTKIVCTLGPATATEEKILQLAQQGMDVARLNFSHGDRAFHGRAIRAIQRVARRLGKPIAILQDLPGPKIRIGEIEGERVTLRTGQTFVLTARRIAGSERAVSVSYPGFVRDVRVGDPILLGDGEVELETVKKGREEVVCRVAVGGVLSSHKGIHFPRSRLSLPSLTPRDRRDLRFGIARGVNLIALSFVRRKEDVLEARRARGGAEVPILAKIEKHEALGELDAILEVVDAIMVARGDLGLEVPPESIPALQKMIIRKANRLGKPVITATQMLRSMVQEPRPTRAEVADIANAVLDGTDALMLSEESAVGNYPVEAVRTMARVALETEKILEPRLRFEGLERSIPEAISRAAISLAEDLRVKAFLIPTTTGSTARMIARYRPAQPIIAISHNPQTVRSLCLVWGVYPFEVRRLGSVDRIIAAAERKALELGAVRRGDLVAVTAGLPLHQAGSTNLITVKAVA
jgi:pyruvate kinase